MYNSINYANYNLNERCSDELLAPPFLHCVLEN